jgi:hypothetical protein
MAVRASEDRADRPKAKHLPIGGGGPARGQATRNKGLGSWEVSAVDPLTAVTAAHPSGQDQPKRREGKGMGRTDSSARDGSRVRLAPVLTGFSRLRAARVLRLRFVRNISGAQHRGSLKSEHWSCRQIRAASQQEAPPAPAELRHGCPSRTASRHCIVSVSIRTSRCPPERGGRRRRSPWWSKRRRLSHGLASNGRRLDRQSYVSHRL